MDLLRDTFLLLIISLFLPFTGNASSHYQFDHTHTYATWQVSHFGFSNLSGKIMASGTLILDEKKPQQSKVTVTMNTTQLSTAISELDNVLKSRQFFDVQRFPTATFTSDKIEILGREGAKVSGILTLKGISKPVVLFVRLNKIGRHPYFRKQAVGFSAKTRLLRSDFGMGAYSPGVGNEANVTIEAEAELTK